MEPWNRPRKAVWTGHAGPLIDSAQACDRTNHAPLFTTASQRIWAAEVNSCAPFRIPAPVRMAHKNRVSYLMLEKGILRVDGHCLLLCQADSCMEIPGSLLSCLMLEPGISVTHEAMKLCGENGTLVIWVGEGGTRFYGAAHAQQDPIMVLLQASIHSNQPRRIIAAARLYEIMFDDPMPPSFTIDKLRGIEGARVKKIYLDLASKHGVHWLGRDEKSPLNTCIGFATSCLYALCEVAILAAGYHPGIGVIHSGNPRSLVFDLADTVKFHSVVPLAFEVAASNPSNLNMAIRHACRDLFARDNLFEKLLANLETIFETDS